MLQPCLALLAQRSPYASGGEASVRLPEFHQDAVRFLGGASGASVLWVGALVCALGIAFGLASILQIARMPAHRSLTEVSELIYATCAAYLRSQARYLARLAAIVGLIVVGYFGMVQRVGGPALLVILLFSLLGIAGTFGVAWLGVRVNNYANARAAFASLRGQPLPVYAIPLKAGMSLGTLLISVALLCNLLILLLAPPHLAGPCLVGFAVGGSLGASALRIAGGIFTKIADIGADLMKITFQIGEDDARNPGVIADCAGDNAGDSVGPTADGFETYGVTSVALIVFVTRVIDDTTVQVQLLTWLFAVATAMIPASVGSYLVNGLYQRAALAGQSRIDFEAPLTALVRLTSVVSIVTTFVLSYLLVPNLAGDKQLWWQLAAIIALGTAAGALIPEVIKAFTSTGSAHVREVVEASRQGGASLNVLSGLVAGNFSAFWMGLLVLALMAAAWGLSAMGLRELIPLADGSAAAVFAFGLLAFGFLSMGPVTIAVDSYGPVTDNAQSVFELSRIETLPDIEASVRGEFGFAPDFKTGKLLLEQNDGAGNTFKATAKPVLIGTAVVGATTLVFSILLELTHRLETERLRFVAITHPPFLLGLIAGTAVMYWFAGASTQAVSTGAHRAVEFIRGHIRLDTARSASIEDSRAVVQICTQYAQAGTSNIFFALLCGTLAAALADAFFFVGYLVSMAVSGLFLALFMANAGGAWDNAKKIVEVELGLKNTPLHAACVVGDTVGDPYKDTSSVAMNPVIKFTTLFGLMAAGLGHALSEDADGRRIASFLAVLLTLGALYFVRRSFYGMRIGSVVAAPAHAAPTAVVTYRTDASVGMAPSPAAPLATASDAPADERSPAVTHTSAPPSTESAPPAPDAPGAEPGSGA